MDKDTFHSPQGNGFGSLGPRYAAAYSKPSRVKNERNKNRAMAEINSQASPVRLNREFFSVVLTPLGFSLPPTLGSLDSFLEFDPEEEKQVNGSDIGVIQCSIDSFEKSVQAASDFSGDLPIAAHQAPFDMELPLKVVPHSYDVDIQAIKTSDTEEEYVKRCAPTFFLPPLFPHLSGASTMRSEKLKEDFRRLKLATYDPLVVFERDDVVTSERVPDSEILAHVADVVRSGVFQNAKQAKIHRARSKLISPPPISDYYGFTADQYKYVIGVMNSNDSDRKITVHEASRLRFVYCPSGGGKTTMIAQSRFPSIYIDVDTVIEEHASEFKLFRSLYEQHKDSRYMDQFFKSVFFSRRETLYEKIVLLHHPRQLPNCFRQGYNELILVPSQFNWQLRSFDRNLFSLLSVYGKTVILSDFKSYDRVVRQFFRVRLSS